MHIDENLLTGQRGVFQPGIARPTPLTFGGTLWEFSRPGDRVPKHQHPDVGHATVILKGFVRLVTPTREVELEAGDIVDCAPNEDHEFIAVTTAAMLLNVRHRG